MIIYLWTWSNIGILLFVNISYITYYLHYILYSILSSWPDTKRFTFIILWVCEKCRPLHVLADDTWVIVLAECFFSAKGHLYEKKPALMLKFSCQSEHKYCKCHDFKPSHYSSAKGEDTKLGTFFDLKQQTTSWTSPQEKMWSSVVSSFIISNHCGMCVWKECYFRFTDSVRLTWILKSR